MPPSNALSPRRGILSRPIVCRPSPPPPTSWEPPLLIPTRTVATFSGFPPTPPIDREISCVKDPLGFSYQGTFNAGVYDNETILLTYLPLTDQMGIHLFGYNITRAWSAQRATFPLVIPGPTTYGVNTWDAFAPGVMTLTLFFTF